MRPLAWAILASSLVWGIAAADRARGDLDGNGKVGFSDFLILASNYGGQGDTFDPDSPMAPSDSGDCSESWEIHCEHILYGIPLGTPASNDLIIRSIYALSSNDQTKLADWVAYRLDKETGEGESITNRTWKPDPWLESDETLEPDDYTGAYDSLGTDRGHQAPLASFKGQGLEIAKKTNYLSNITPQRSNLNQGPWKELEEAVRDLVSSSDVPVYVMTGPLYEREMLGLPGADEEHRVPSGYWKVVCVQETEADAGSVKAVSFIFEQETPRSSQVSDHLVPVDEVESRSGLDLMSLMPDSIEEAFESVVDSSWASSFLGE